MSLFAMHTARDNERDRGKGGKRRIKQKCVSVCVFKMDADVLCWNSIIRAGNISMHALFTLYTTSWYLSSTALRESSGSCGHTQCDTFQDFLVMLWQAARRSHFLWIRNRTAAQCLCVFVCVCTCNQGNTWAAEAFRITPCVFLSPHRIHQRT
jgi:hypothetical protein